MVSDTHWLGNWVSRSSTILSHQTTGVLNQRPLPHSPTHPNQRMPSHQPAVHARVPSPLSQMPAGGPAAPSQAQIQQQFQHLVGQQQRARASGIRHGTDGLLGHGHRGSDGVNAAPADPSTPPGPNAESERDPEDPPLVAGFHTSVRELQDRHGQTWQVTVTENTVPIASPLNVRGLPTNASRTKSQR